MRLNDIILSFILLVPLWACGTQNKEQSGKGNEGLLQEPEVNIVEVMTLQKTDFAREIISNGRLSALHKATLRFGTQGIIESISVKNGQMVQAGAQVAYLYHTDLSLALEAAETAMQKAELDLYDALASQGYATRDTTSVPATPLAVAKVRSGYQSAAVALKKAHHDLDKSLLRAPFKGKVIDLTCKEYDLAGTEPLCRLVDDSVFEVEFSVMESEYALLSIGSPVRIIPYSNNSHLYQGTVTDINPAVDKNGQLRVLARVVNDGHLLEGMNVKVTVERILSGVLVVPRSAVVIRDNMDVLFTYTDDGKAHWVYINILYSNSSSHVVTADTNRNAVLSEGDRIIVSGNLNLADESAVELKQ